MNRHTVIFLAFLLLLTQNSFAQLTPLWEVDLPAGLRWQKVTSSGTYLVATEGALLSFAQADGKKQWENPALAKFNEDQIQQLPGSFLLKAQNDNELLIFSPIDGKIKFSNAKSGIVELSTTEYLPQTNGIFIAGKKASNEPAMLLVDINTGNVRWELTEKAGRIISVNEVSANEIMLTTLFYVYKLNSGNGEVIWKNSTSPEVDAMGGGSALGSLFQDFAEEMTKDFDFVINFYKHPTKPIVIIASEQKEETTSSTGDVSISYNNSYIAFNMSDGSRVWSKPKQMKGKLGDLAFYQNGVIMLPNDGGRSKYNFYELSASAEGAWGKKGNGNPIKGGVYSHLMLGKYILLISKVGDNTFLDLLDPATGELVYDKPLKISGELVQTFETSAGITYITTEEVNIIDPATGSQKLSKSINTTPALTVLEGDLLYVFDNKKGVIQSLNITSGELKDITSDKLKFEGKESPSAIELRTTGLLLTSQQNLALYDLQGKLVYQQYHPAPRESGLKRALLYAQAVRAAYISANAYAAAGAIGAAAQQNPSVDPVTGALVEGIETVYNDLGDAASDFAKESFLRAQARFKATTAGRDYNMLLTENAGKVAIVRVNKDTGEIEATIDLGKEKEPKYAIDDVTGRVFLNPQANKIVCYQF